MLIDILKITAGVVIGGLIFMYAVSGCEQLQPKIQQPQHININVGVSAPLPTKCQKGTRAKQRFEGSVKYETRTRFRKVGAIYECLRVKCPAAWQDPSNWYTMPPWGTKITRTIDIYVSPCGNVYERGRGGPTIRHGPGRKKSGIHRFAER